MTTNPTLQSSAVLYGLLNILLTVAREVQQRGAEPGGHFTRLRAAIESTEKALAQLAVAEPPAPASATPVASLRQLVDQICDVHGIGALSRMPGVILTNVQNAHRRAKCLDRVEAEFTTTQQDQDGPYDECPLGWGVDPETYGRQFKAALSAREATRLTIEQAIEAACRAKWPQWDNPRHFSELAKPYRRQELMAEVLRGIATMGSAEPQS